MVHAPFMLKIEASALNVFIISPKLIPSIHVPAFLKLTVEVTSRGCSKQGHSGFSS